LSSSFSDIVEQKRVIVCVGSGGVGKTTTAAAIAVDGALMGRKTLVLTIDPAKRLANSLGLKALGHTVQQVPAETLAALGPRRPGGELWAMMLDQKRAFDEVVEHYASRPEAIKRILANPVYAQISGSLTGAQEYAAMAKLHAFHAERQYDLIVVDTPPTAHALDFLDAPQKLSAAIDSPAVEWFRNLRQTRGGGRGESRWSLVGRTGAYMLRRISKFVGSQFLDDLAVFFTEFDDILGGFRQRAEMVFELLRQPEVGFVLVSSPDPMAIDEALFFHERLRASAMRFCAFVVNRVHEDRPVAAMLPELVERARAVPAVAGLALADDALVRATGELCASHADLQALARGDRRSIDRLRTAGGAGALLIEVPFLKVDVHDVRGLGAIGTHLFARATEAPAVDARPAVRVTGA
jgi:anion-transporting  ArsA/GET3 family ATPase